MAEKKNQQDSSAGKKRRWRPQFSLKLMSLLTLLAALILGFLGRPSAEYLHDKKVAKRIKELGGTCELVEASPSGGLFVDDYLKRLKVKPWFDRFYRRIRTIQLSPAMFDDDETDSRKTVLTLADAEAIAKCQHLTTLSLPATGLTDELLAELAKTDSIDQLYIDQNRQLTDAGLDSIRGHKSIKHVSLVGTRVSNRQYEDLLRTTLTARPSYNAMARRFRSVPSVQGYDAVDYEITMRAYSELEQARLFSSGMDGVNGGYVRTVDFTDLDQDEFAHFFDQYLRSTTNWHPRRDSQGGLAIRADQFDHAVAQAIKDTKRPVVYIELDANVLSQELVDRVKLLKPHSLKLTGLVSTSHVAVIMEPNTLNSLHIDSNLELDAEILRHLGHVSYLRIPNASITPAAAKEAIANRWLNLECLWAPHSLMGMRDEILAAGVTETVVFPQDLQRAHDWVVDFVRRAEQLPVGESTKTGFQLARMLSLDSSERSQLEPDFFRQLFEFQETVSELDRLIGNASDLNSRCPPAIARINEMVGDQAWQRHPLREIAAEPLAWRDRAKLGGVLSDEMSHAVALMRFCVLSSRTVAFELMRGESDAAFEQAYRIAVASSKFRKSRKVISIDSRYTGDWEFGLEAWVSLAHNATDTSTHRAMADQLFLVPREDEVTFDKPPLLNPWQKICIVAPNGRHIASVRADHDRPQLSTHLLEPGRQPADSKPLPSGTRYVLISADSLPVTVESRLAERKR